MRLIHALAPLFVVGCSLPSAPNRPSAPPLREHEHEPSPIDVRHYAIDVTLDPAAGSIEASTRVDFAARRRLSSVELDLMEDLKVSGVDDNEGRELAFEHRDDRLEVTLAEPLVAGQEASLTVRYGGAPAMGLWFTGDDGTGTPNQVFSQGQCDESRGWFPCWDHPSDRVTSEIAATVPAGWITIAAGDRVASDERGALRTDRWRMEDSHPNYLITLVAGELELVRDAWRDVELWYAAEEAYEPWLADTFRDTPDILAFLSEYTGLDYPYSKYSQACVDSFHWGGMENISATTLTPLSLTDERGRMDSDSVDLFVHEAAHQWFGDLITCNDWRHVWLNEGFATYFECLWVEETEGRDAMRALVRSYQESYLAHDVGQDRQPTVSALYREPGDLFDANIYEGGAVRLHLLRFLVGDEVFRQGVRDYVRAHADGNVETDDLQRVFERVSGRSLERFFDEWLLSPGFPEFDVRWDWDAERGVELDVVQVQEPIDGTPRVFTTPVAVEVLGGDGPVVHRLTIDEREERFLLPCADEPLYVRFDAGGWIPKLVRWSRAPSEWMALAERSTDVTARFDAVRALGDIAESAADIRPERHAACVDVLVGRLRDDASPWVRRTAATALGAAGGDEARAQLMEAGAEDPEPSVREAALMALTFWGADSELALYAEGVYGDGFTYATMGAAGWLYSTADPGGAFDWLVAHLPAESPHDNLRERLLGVLTWVDDGRVRDELERWLADPDTAPSARAAAARGLAALGEKPIATARALAAQLDCTSYRLRTALVESLAELNNPESRRRLREHYELTQDGYQRRVIEAALTEGP
ncbi:MAG: M1 family metallopeptidase [Planctomycetota bacterium]